LPVRLSDARSSDVAPELISDMPDSPKPLWRHHSGKVGGKAK